MKIQTIRNLSVALLAVSSLFGQENQRLKFEVPFSFHMGDKALPSGKYVLDTDASRNIVRVRSVDGGNAALMLSIAIGKPARRDEGKLIFSRYGDEYFLSEIWGPDTDGRALAKTKREKEVAASHSRDVELIVAAK